MTISSSLVSGSQFPLVIFVTFMKASPGLRPTGSTLLNNTVAHTLVIKSTFYAVVIFKRLLPWKADRKSRRIYFKFAVRLSQRPLPYCGDKASQDVPK